MRCSETLTLPSPCEGEGKSKLTFAPREVLTMELLAVTFMFIFLCVDNMVMANMSGMKPQNNDVRSRMSLKIAFSFSLFHVIFLVIGWLLAALFWPAGRTFLAASWVAFAFIALIGIRLLLETVEKSPSFSAADEGVNKKIIKTSAWLALNTLMIGFAMKIMNASHLFWAVFILFAVSMVMSLLGFLTGKPDSKKISTKIAESIAGVAMIVMAIRLIIMYH